MNDLKTQLKQVGMLINVQNTLMRVIKAGLYGHEVAGDVERCKNYLEAMTRDAEVQLKILKDAIKNQPDEVMVAEPIPAPEVK